MADLAQPRFVDRGALTVAGFFRDYKPDGLGQIPLQWNALQQQLQLVSGRVGGDAFGVWYGVLNGGGAFHYLSGVAVGEYAPVHPQFSRASIAAQHYAVFEHRGSPQEIRKTMDAILGQWLPKSGRTLVRGDENTPDFFERYSEEFNSTGSGQIEIWVPIQK